MKAKYVLATAVCAASLFALSSCSKEQEAVAPTAEAEVSAAVLTQIRALGFSTQDVKKMEEGYLVEGDIVVTNEDLATVPGHQLLRVGDEEQYRTTNLVRISGRSRTIRVVVSDDLPAAYRDATDEAIRRYNALRLRLRFLRVSSAEDDDIDIFIFKSSLRRSLAWAGFPNRSGDPYNRISVNPAELGTARPRTYIASVLAHELGHCIGFRHTDYKNRRYSCGVERDQEPNEGQDSPGTIGAVNIPGTPRGADPNSWMLACINTGANRPFNANDREALRYLY
jgi:hypothetical protein